MGSLDTVGTLYDCCGNLITRSDDYTPCGKLNFRIIRYLNTNSTYYVRVTEARSNTGSYTLKVTQKRLVNSISIIPSQISLEHIGKVYKLPVSPGTFTNVEGAEPLNSFSAWNEIGKEGNVRLLLDIDSPFIQGAVLSLGHSVPLSTANDLHPQFY